MSDDGEVDAYEHDAFPFGDLFVHGGEDVKDGDE